MPIPRLCLDRLEPWVSLTATVMGDFVIAELRSENAVHRAVLGPDGEDVLGELSAGQLAEAGNPSALESVRQLFEELTQREWPRLGSLPLYIDPHAPWPGTPPDTRSEPWWGLGLDWIFPSARPPDGCQIVALPRLRGLWRPRPVPKLPLVIRAVGSEARGWIDGVGHLEGLTLQLREAERAWSGGAAQILVFAGVDAQEVLRHRLKSKPQLLLCVDEDGEGPDLAWWLRAVPPGCSAVVRLSAGPLSSEDWTREFLYGLTHDVPFHEAARVAGIHMDGDLVLADPKSNHDLRLVRVMDKQRREEERLAMQPAPGQAAKFIERIRREHSRHRELAGGGVGEDPVPLEADRFLSELGAGGEDGARFEEAMLGATFGRVSFVAETQGLAPLAASERAVREARELASRLEPRMAAVPERRWIEQNQDRRVNLVLERRLENLLAGGDDMMSRGLEVEDGWALATDCDYLLRLRIGRPFSIRLYTDDEEPPPIDPALPPVEGEYGHELEVAVFGLDFAVRGARVQPLHLPASGSSETLSFQVKTPPQVGSARLRVCLFHQNNLIQSFLLHAETSAPDEEWRSERQLRQELEYSRTRRFTEIDEFKERAISIGVNDSGATHTFMVKKDGRASEISLPQALLAQEIGRFRDELARASMKDGALRFTEESTSSGATDADFDAAIRALANAGRELYRRLAKESSGLQEMLEDLQGSSGRTLQMVRHDLGFAFPWAGIYDFKVPRHIHGAVPAPVCRGKLGGKDCPHGPGDGVFCIRGFWGVRHSIEQLMGKDAVGREPVSRLRGHGPGLALGVRDRHTVDLETALPNAGSLANRDAILDALWDEQGPGIVVLLGHVETNDIVGEPTGTRLVIAQNGTERWLQGSDVFDRKDDSDAISDPAPLVLLLGCGTASADPLTLNDLFSELLHAGAAGAVGTECVTFVEPAVRFAKYVITALGEGSSLSECVRAFRQTLLEEGNPLGFTFTAFGNADMTR